MVTSLKEQPLKKAPVYRNINAFTDLTSYRLPPAGWVSILHRVSGALMFLLLPFMIWMFDTSVTSEISFEQFTQRLQRRRRLRAGLVRQAGRAGLIWAFLHHFIAGLRHLWMDVDHSGRQGVRPQSRRWSRSVLSSRARRWRSAPSSFGLY